MIGFVNNKEIKKKIIAPINALHTAEFNHSLEIPINSQNDGK